MTEATEQAILDQLAALKRDIDEKYKALAQLIMDRTDAFTGADK